MTDADDLPLLRRFPALRSVPRAQLGRFPSPVERLELPDLRGELWLKRDDLNAPHDGGNKVRSLEFLLGEVLPGDEVLTLGGHGSTHVMATAAHARRLGATVRAVRFPHEMTRVSTRVADRALALGTRVQGARWIGSALLRAGLIRLRTRAHWIPLGGTSPRGVLGHVNAALELLEQIDRGELPMPDRVVAPLGTGGTTAGLALGFAIAGRRVRVVGARVAPRIATNRRRILKVARRTARYMERLTGEHLPRVAKEDVEAWHGAYAGAYGRPHEEATRASRLLYDTSELQLDDTYSAKAFAAALAFARDDAGRTLFWLTFDARWLHDAPDSLHASPRVTG